MDSDLEVGRRSEKRSSKARELYILLANLKVVI